MRKSTVPEAGVRLKVSVPVAGYRRRMFFNRFHTEWIDGHALVHFGLIDGSGVLKDSYACVLTKGTLADCQPGMTSFLEHLGGPTARKPPQWRPPYGQMRTDLATVVSVGVLTEGEVLLSAFALAPAAEKSEASRKRVKMDGLAQLRCEVDLLKWLIADLYGG